MKRSVEMDEVLRWPNLKNYLLSMYDRDIDDDYVCFNEWGVFTRFVVISITEKAEEVEIDGYDTIKEAKDAIQETEEDGSGWTFDSLWCDDKQIEVDIKIQITIKDKEI